MAFLKSNDPKMIVLKQLANGGVYIDTTNPEPYIETGQRPLRVNNRAARPWWARGANNCRVESGGREVPGRWLLDTKFQCEQAGQFASRSSQSFNYTPSGISSRCRMFLELSTCPQSHEHSNYRGRFDLSKRSLRGPEYTPYFATNLGPLRWNQQKYVDQTTSRMGKLIRERWGLTFYKASSNAWHHIGILEIEQQPSHLTSYVWSPHH